MHKKKLLVLYKFCFFFLFFLFLPPWGRYSIANANYTLKKKLPRDPPTSGLFSTRVGWVPGWVTFFPNLFFRKKIFPKKISKKITHPGIHIFLFLGVSLGPIFHMFNTHQHVGGSLGVLRVYSSFHFRFESAKSYLIAPTNT